MCIQVFYFTAQDCDSNGGPDNSGVGRQSRYHICVGLWIIMWLHMKPSASHGGERPWAKGENLGHERRA